MALAILRSTVLPFLQHAWWRCLIVLVVVWAFDVGLLNTKLRGDIQDITLVTGSLWAGLALYFGTLIKAFERRLWISLPFVHSVYFATVEALTCVPIKEFGPHDCTISAVFAPLYRLLLPQLITLDDEPVPLPHFPRVFMITAAVAMLWTLIAICVRRFRSRTSK